MKSLPNWTNDTAYIIGGGQSILDQFDVPDELQGKVHANTLPVSVYAPYMSRLFVENVIGVNAAFLLGDWIDILYFGDDTFWRNYKDKIMDYPRQVISSSRLLKNNKKVEYYERLRTMPYGISTQKGTVAWNNNSGCSAISIAAQAGAKRIILLGFDMHDKRATHFHSEYFWMERKPTFDFHLRGMKTIKQHAKELDIEIINASPTSEIKEFPKVQLKELLS